MRYRLHKLLNRPVGSTQVEQLDHGPTKFDADLHVPYLRGTLTFTRLIDTIMVCGLVDTEVTVQCVRSLEDFGLCLPVVLDNLLYTLTGSPTDEPDRQISDDGWLDLTETLREEIIMAIPINPINPKYASEDGSELLAELGDNGDNGDAGENDRDWLTVKLSDAADAGETEATAPKAHLEED